MQPTGSYSELFDSDPEYVAALATLPLSGQEVRPVPSTSVKRSPTPPAKNLKRTHFDDGFDPDFFDEQTRQEGENGSSADLGNVHYLSSNIPSGFGSGDHTSDTVIYGASKFGGWGEYIGRKRAKLQIQNAELAEGSTAKPQIFKGVQIYVRNLMCQQFVLCSPFLL